MSFSSSKTLPFIPSPTSISANHCNRGIMRTLNTVVRQSLVALALLLPSSLVFAQTAEPESGLEHIQLDPEMRNVIMLWDAIRGTPINQGSPQDDRQQFFPQDAAKIIARGYGSAQGPIPVGKVTDGITIPGRDGNQIPIRIYTPIGTGPFPVVTYYHGGGFVLATINTSDEGPRALSTYAGAIVVSVEYRKAPESPFPAAYNDAVDAYKWVLSNIGTYNGISSKVALAGESAGGNLATEVAIAARDQGLQMPTHQLLVYPVASSNLNQPSDLLYTSSLLPLNLDDLKFYFSQYVSAADANDPRVIPINNDLHNLPPTTIIAAEVDPLLSDSEVYTGKLQAAGNQVVYSLYTGVAHEFFGMGAVVPKAKAAEQFGASRLAASFK
jgi:acetyl esterase